MDFSFTEEQRQLRNTIREFVEGEIRPHVMGVGRIAEVPRRRLPQTGKTGNAAPYFPRSQGGSGYTYVDYVILMEEFARVDPSIALSAAAHISLCMNHIYIAGSAEQRERYLPKLASGEWIGSWSLTEPESGSDAGQARSNAVRDGDSWVLNGLKTFTTNVHVADVGVVMAVSDRSASSHGISAFIIEKGTPGYSFGRKENKLGMRCSPTGDVILTNCRVADAQLCGAGKASSTACAFWTADELPSRLSRWASPKEPTKRALKYSKQRKQFSRFIEFQAIQHKLADMATEIEASRLLTLRAAAYKDAGMSVNKESSMAKLFASETAVRVSNEAVQIHGALASPRTTP